MSFVSNTTFLKQIRLSKSNNDHSQIRDGIILRILNYLMDFMTMEVE